MTRADLEAVAAAIRRVVPADHITPEVALSSNATDELLDLIGTRTRRVERDPVLSGWFLRHFASATIAGVRFRAYRFDRITSAEAIAATENL